MRFGLQLAFICTLMMGTVSCVVSRSSFEETSQNLRDSQQRVGMLQGALEEVRRQNGALKDKIDELNQRNQSLEMELQTSQENQTQIIEGLRLRIRDLEQRASSLQNQNQALLLLKTQQAAEIEELSHLAKKLEQEKTVVTSQLKDTYDELVHELEAEIKKGEIKITRVKEKLSVNLVEKILFDSGRAGLKPEGIQVLKKVGNALKKVNDKEIRVEGHTDNVPVSGRIADIFPSNWELSTARATTVVRYLQEKEGIEPEKLAASGYANYRPLASNETKEGRAQNRRIEIVLVPLDMGEVLEELK